MKNIKRILSLIIVMALLLTMMAVPAMAKDSDTNETDIIGSLYLSATPTTITVRGATGSYSFRIDDSTTWTTNATFSGLYPNTEHTVYAKTGSAPEITVGKITTKAADYVSNANATSIDAAAPNTFAVTVSHNVSFKDSFSLYYYIPVSSLAGYTNTRILVQRQKYATGETTCTYTQEIFNVSSLPTEVQASTNALRYLLKYNNIAAAELGEVLYLTVYAEKDGVTYVSQLDSYSVAKFAYNNLSKSTVSADNKVMLVDLLNFAAAAQVNFNHNTGNLANAQLTAAQKAMASTLTADSWITCKENIGSGEVQIVSNNVSFGNTTDLIYNVKFPSAYDMTGVVLEATYTPNNSSLGKQTLIVKSSAFVWDAANSRYKVTLPGVPLTEIGCPITAVIKKNGTVVSDTRIYNIESFCKNNYSSASTSANQKNLVLMLMRYSYSSRKVFK